MPDQFVADVVWHLCGPVLIEVIQDNFEIFGILRAVHLHYLHVLIAVHTASLAIDGGSGR